MADSSKKQLIYKDYSAVNTNGSSLNVDMTESSNLLGGEIWYNWQTATSALMRAKEITTSRHHSRFFLAWWTRWAHISDNILGEQPPRHEKMRRDGNDFPTITYRQHRDSRKRFRFLMCNQYFFNSYTSYGFTVTNAVITLDEKLCPGDCGRGVYRNVFLFPRNWEGFVYQSFWSGVWFPLNKSSCDPHPFNVPWDIGKRKGLILFNSIALRSPHRLSIQWKTVTNE